MAEKEKWSCSYVADIFSYNRPNDKIYLEIHKILNILDTLL